MNIEVLAEILYEAWRDAADRVDPNIRRGESARTTIYAPRLSWRSIDATQRMIWTAVARRAEHALSTPVEHYAANRDGLWHPPGVDPLSPEEVAAVKAAYVGEDNDGQE